MICDVDLIDFGMYLCSVVNKVGKDFCVVVLEVIGE